MINNLTIGDGNANIALDIKNTNNTEHYFDFKGGIGVINLVLDDKCQNKKFSFLLCNKKFTEKDFNIESYYDWDLNQNICSARLHLKDHINFDIHDTFSIIENNCIHKILFWITEIHNKEIYRFNRCDLDALKKSISSKFN